MLKFILYPLPLCFKLDPLHENTKKVNSVERLTRHLNKGTPAKDKMFLKLDVLKQDYIICLTAKRKLFFHNKWVPATKLRNQRKEKIKTPVLYRGKERESYLSHVKVQITASKKDIYLVLVYGLTEHPMMLATNKEIKSKDDVIRIARLYFSRWRIEDQAYFPMPKKASCVPSTLP